MAARPSRQRDSSSTMSGGDPLSTVSVQCAGLSIQVERDGSAWVATVPEIPGLIAQHSTLEGVLRQVLEFEKAFFVDAAS